MGVHFRPPQSMLYGGVIGGVWGGLMTGKLNARKVETITKPGRYADGGNLYLTVSDGGSRRWIFLYRWGKAANGKPIRREMGLGSAGKGEVSLAQARQKALEARQQLNAGVDPINHKRQVTDAKRVIPTFGEFADQYLEDHKAKFGNQKHKAQWEMTLGDAYCKSLRSKQLDSIGTADILAVLKPIWSKVPETATRIRQRIEKVLSAARVKAFIQFKDGINPAAWRGHLENLLPARQKLARGHHKALPYEQVADFIESLRQRRSTAALALELCILTATRTSEVLKARWDEFDLEKGVWIIPAVRMKARIEHRVPLSNPALAVLRSLPHLTDNEHAFPGNKTGKPLSNMAMAMQLRRMKRTDITVHGFRSSFRDWAAEKTSYPHQTCEHALAHQISDKAEAAYRRGDQFQKRRDLMEDWASFAVPAALRIAA